MKKRNKYFIKAKELIRLKIEDDKLTEIMCNQNLIELDKPIHNGFNAEWILRKDILNREDAHVYQEALDICKESIFSRREDFKYKDRFGKWNFYLPKLKRINLEEYNTLSPSAKKFFFESAEKPKHWRQGFSDNMFFCTLSYELVILVTKNYITHRKERDGALYRREAEIEHQMN